MSTLPQLQRDLQNFILDGDETVALAIEDSAATSASTRLRIYSDAYRLRLIEALQANYPALERLLGAEQFARATQLYLLANPSRHFSIRWFGHQLAGFFREFDEYRNQPWLAELAEWEWKIAAAFDAPDRERLTAVELAQMAPEDWPTLQLTLQPSVQRCHLTTNVVAIAKAAGDEQTLPSPVRTESADWLIWRQDLVVRYRSLHDVESEALSAVQNGSTFGDLCEAIARHMDADDVPQQAAAFLRQWIDEQLLVTLHSTT